MPPKKGKGSAKGKGKKGTKATTNLGVDPVKLTKQIMVEYEKRCAELNSGICPSIKLALRDCIEQEKLLTKFIVCPRDRKELKIWADEDLYQMFDPNYVPKTPEKKKPKSKSRSRSSSAKRTPKKGEPVSGQALIDRFLKQDPPSDKPLAKVQPILEALRSKRYTFIDSLYVWDMVLNLSEMTSISNFIQKGFYAIAKVELIDCLIQPYSMKEFAKSLGYCKTLTEVILDCNEFGDEGCAEFCAGILGNKYLITLSLCYCNLTYLSGKCLGQAISETTIIDLFLDGNELEAEGCINLLDEVAEYAQFQAREREEAEKKRLEEEAEKALKASEASAAESGEGDSKPASAKGKKKGGKKSGKKGGKKGKRRGRRKKKEPTGPIIAPVLRKLHIADNGIDQVGRGANFGCLKCVITICNMIENSKTLAEIDFWGNDIGDVGGRLLFESLQTRKDAKHPGMAMKVCARMNSETFQGITRLASGLKKKKKRGKRRKKK